MRANRGFALALILTLAGVFAHAAPGGSPVTEVRLKTITSQIGSKTTSLIVEATEPVPYVATRPDPLTLFLDLRNVTAEGVANKVTANAKSLIADVSVEATDSMGVPASRVRVLLAAPVVHRVRSEKNRIVLDFDRAADDTMPSVLPPATRVQEAVVTPVSVPVVRDPIAALSMQTLTGSGGAPPQAQAAPQPAAPQQPPAQTPAQPAPAAQAPETVAAPGQRRYTGTPVSFDFQDADLRAVLRTFHEITGLNIVIDPTVQGTVNVALTDVPWDQALDIILRANRLGYIVDGTIVRIAPLSALADEESQRRKLADEQALSGELRVMTKTLSYARAQDLVTLLTRSTLSQRGTVQVDPRTNTLIITDLQPRLTTAEELIANLDTPQPQVEIEARIVQANKNYARNLGVQWGFNGRVDPALGNSTNLAFPNNGSLSGNVDLSVPSTSSVNLALGSVNGAFNLDVALTAAENEGNVRVLSTPRVSTQNNIEAEIAQGVQVPYQTVANNTVTTAFRDAALVLRVKPQITAVGTVIMTIMVDKGSVGELFNGVPSINTQRANTTVLVSDGETTVIGGIYGSDQRASTSRTPGLSRVPFLSWLFKNDSVQDQTTELLIFITPRIMRS